MLNVINGPNTKKHLGDLGKFYISATGHVKICIDIVTHLIKNILHQVRYMDGYMLKSHKN